MESMPFKYATTCCALTASFCARFACQRMPKTVATSDKTTRLTAARLTLWRRMNFEARILQAENQNPIARAQVDPDPAEVGQTVTFDASTRVTRMVPLPMFFWIFGDGSSSTNTVASHAYTSPGTFTFALTVTDNLGATDGLSGQIVVSETQARLTVQPASGVLSAGNSEVITVSLDAKQLATGVVNGEVRIAGNGGTVLLPLAIAVGTPVSVSELPGLPREFSLLQNYPNPFNPETKIHYTLPQAAEVRLTVYDLLGRQVAILLDGRQHAGLHNVLFDAGNLPSGVYMYRLQADQFEQTGKMLLLK